jgi:hypothetical protein
VVNHRTSWEHEGKPGHFEVDRIDCKGSLDVAMFRMPKQGPQKLSAKP